MSERSLRQDFTGQLPVHRLYTRPVTEGSCASVREVCLLSVPLSSVIHSCSQLIQAMLMFCSSHPLSWNIALTPDLPNAARQDTAA